MADDVSRGQQEPQLSGWAATGMAFAACVLTLMGAFQVIGGLAAIIENDFFVLGREYAFEIDVTTWGWIHLVLGVIMMAIGLSLFTGRTWARGAAIILASLSAIANFLFIPYYPFWALLVIAIDIWIIWSLTRPGANLIRD